MKILIVANGDWSGAGNALMQSINDTTEHEARAISYTQRGSYTKYPFDIIDPSVDDLRKWWNWADIINIHDGAELLFPIDIEEKPVIETYHGTWYRNDPEYVNLLAKKRGRLQTCVTQDLSAYGPTWIGRAMKDLSDIYEPSTDKFVVVHSPTSRYAKGTESIIRDLNRLSEESNNFELRIIEGLPNEACLEEKRKANLFIDISPTGLTRGFGTNSLEAWSLGIPVISTCSEPVGDMILKNMDEDEFPFASPLDNHGADYSENKMEGLVMRFMEDDEFRRKYIRLGRDYVRKYHSQEHVADKFVSLCEDSLRSFSSYKSKNSISVCMIMRNEENNIRRVLSSARGLTNDFVIVDTGSSDNSVGLCESLGCRVLVGGDYMNKAESRNRAIDAATGKWVVILDMDEVLTDPTGLKKWIDKIDGSGAVSAHIRAGCSMGRGGNPLEVFDQMRVWRKEAYRYKYRAHELPEFQAGCGLQDNLAKIPILFAHYPDKSKEHHAWKLQYTLDRLKLDVADYPDGPRPLYYLGRQYLYLGDYEQAIENLKKYLELTNEIGHWDRPNACFDLYKCYANKGDAEKDEKKKGILFRDAMQWLYMACVENPTNRKWWFELANRYYSGGKYHLCIGLITLMNCLPVDQQWGYRATACEGAIPMDLLSRAFWKIKDYESGFMCARKAVDMEPTNDRLRKNLEFFEKKIKGVN
jgi:glycosyltransferase involved in cell wall biosynthesis